MKPKGTVAQKQVGHIISPLAEGNRALRENNFAAAIALYLEALQATPALGKTIAFNIAQAKKKHLETRNAVDRARVAVCGWDLAHNAAGRVYTLAKLYETFSDVEIIGTLFPKFGTEIWEPIRNTKIPVHSFVVEDESRFLDHAVQLVAAHPYDIVHLSKPRIPNIFFGILYKLIWDAKILVDIDDEELAFVNADTPISIDDYIKAHGSLPSLIDLTGKEWTRLAVGLAKEFDGITVSNPALQQRYGGEIIRHARDEKLYQPSLELKRKSREKLGIGQDKKVVLFFGTPLNHKGLLEIADAISSLKRNDVVFAIIGDFPDPSLKAKLLEKKEVDYFFLGNQPFETLPEVVAIGDYCVLLLDPDFSVSHFQVPAKLSDALGMGLVVVASDLVANSDLKAKEFSILTTGDELGKTLAEVISNDNLANKYHKIALSGFLDEFSYLANSEKLKNSFTALKSVDKKAKANWFLNLLPNKHFLRSAAEFVTHKAISPGPSSTLESVDLVIPVFNALEDVKKCLCSILEKRDGFLVTAYIINDGSDDETTAWLRDFCSQHPMLKLIEHEKNCGYTVSVNTGLKASKAPYVITLNSDTIVANGWLKGMARCLNSDTKIGIVGPLSNAASWQNVPNLYDETGNFAVNDLPPGMTVEKMARIVESASRRTYPRLPFVNGFCFMIKRDVIEAIGIMDEENFPVGYGEENDFCIRAGDAGFSLAIADDVYVYHAKSKSFGHDRRKVLAKQGSDMLKQKHTIGKFNSLVAEIKKTEVLDNVRERIESKIKEDLNIRVNLDTISIKVLFLLPVKGGSGGAHSVVQEVSEMRRLGMTANIAVKEADKRGLLDTYQDIVDADDLFIGFTEQNILTISESYDVVVGTIFNSMSLVKKIVEVYPHIVPAYYIQDYEPLFFSPEMENWKIARESYTLVPDAVLFAKTHWIADKVKQEHGVTVHKVSPSIDHNVYQPAVRRDDGKIHLAAMIRPQTPRRGAERTMRVLSRLTKTHGNSIAIHLFGCPEDDSRFQCLQRDFDYKNYGVLKRPEVATLLGQSDIFIDLSDYQAFGRTALEAMACGCVAVVPVHGGADEFAIDAVNAIVLDSYNEDEAYSRLNSVLCRETDLRDMQRAGLLTASTYSVHNAAVSEICLFGRLISLHRMRNPKIEKPRMLVMPSRRKDGIPSESGYVRVLAPYGLPAIRRHWKVAQSSANELPQSGTADVVLIQRDARDISRGDLQDWLSDWRLAGGKLIYEIDDNLFDLAELKISHFEGDSDLLAEKVRWLAKEADVVTVSTQPLQELLLRFNPNVRVVPNFLDADLWRIGRPRLAGPGVFQKKPDDPIRIGYFGTPTNHQDLDIVAAAMRQIEQEYGERVEIEVIGGFQNIKPLFGTRVGLPKKNDYPNLVNWLLRRVHWDIGIIPTLDDKFNNSKSYLKFLEYSALGLASVCSDVQSLSGICQNGINCLTVSNTTESWVVAIKRLIEDKELRNRLASTAFTNLNEKHLVHHASDLLLAGLNSSKVSGNSTVTLKTHLDQEEFRQLLQNDAGIKYGRFTYPCRLKVNPEANYLSVQLHGAIDREKTALPVFSRWNYGKVLGSHVLAICDPTIYFDETLRIGWYLGDRNQNIVEGIVAIAENCAKMLGIDPDHIIFSGSSGGGFASLQAAAHSENGKAIVLNPQTNLLFRQDLLDYTKRVLGSSIEEAQEFFGSRWNAIESIMKASRSGKSIKVVFVQNVNDKSTYKRHYIPFANEYGLDISKPSSVNGNFMSILYHGNFAHEAEPPDVAKTMIKVGIPFLLSGISNVVNSLDQRVQNG
jgi:glycosyltransferase involved in cell wall biosynthesis